jgi:nucleoside 2-deoxyribosyltransferase
MKLYLAGRYSQKDEIAAIAKRLQFEGFAITSSWLEEPHAPGTTLDQLSDTELAQYAQNDLNDIDEADAIVFFSVDPTIPTVRGGRHVEFGYALAKRKAILVVGQKENIFHYLKKVIRHFETVDELLPWLKGFARAWDASSF